MTTMMFNDLRVDGIQAELTKGNLTKIQFLQENKEHSEVVGELKLDRDKTWTLICHLMRNYSHFYLPSLECANCKQLAPLKDIKCLCADCIKNAE